MEESKSPSIFRSWLDVLTQPGEEVFEKERHGPNATLSTALIWIVIAGIIAAILGTISAVIGSSAMSSMMPMLEQMDMPPEQRAIFDQILQTRTSPTGLIMSFVQSLLMIPLVFLLGAGLTHLISKMFGGQGTFGNTAYLQSLFMVPINLIAAIPFIGGCIGFILYIYSIALWFFSTKAEQKLTTGKTIGVAIVAGIAFLAIFACIGGVFGAAFAGMSGMAPQ